jgi:hypothetical protein
MLQAAGRTLRQQRAALARWAASTRARRRQADALAGASEYASVQAACVALRAWRLAVRRQRASKRSLRWARRNRRCARLLALFGRWRRRAGARVAARQHAREALLGGVLRAWRAIAVRPGEVKALVLAAEARREREHVRAALQALAVRALRRGRLRRAAVLARRMDDRQGAARALGAWASACCTIREEREQAQRVALRGWRLVVRMGREEERRRRGRQRLVLWSLREAGFRSQYARMMVSWHFRQPFDDTSGA